MLVEEHIENRGIRNPDVLRVIRAVPRHEFVPPNMREFAYEDRPLSIGYGATISQPYIVAAMTELLNPKPHHKVLEIGTGSGYQAAVLANLVREVYSIEIVPELARTSAETLRRLGYKNVYVRQGDGYKGWPDQAPFDGIILTAAPPEVPHQQLIVIEKMMDGRTRRRTVFPVMFVPMVPGRN
jgi:protein-L-isoaspartate(D-aspartate) O-methyltransferase